MKTLQLLEPGNFTVSIILCHRFAISLSVVVDNSCHLPHRGPETRKVIDFLISLPEKHPDQTHNHDFTFTGFLGLLPIPSYGSDLKDTWKEYDNHEEREGLYRGEGFEDMHLQGRIIRNPAKAKSSPMAVQDEIEIPPSETKQKPLPPKSSSSPVAVQDEIEIEISGCKNNC